MDESVFEKSLHSLFTFDCPKAHNNAYSLSKLQEEINKQILQKYVRVQSLFVNKHLPTETNSMRILNIFRTV